MDREALTETLVLGAVSGMRSTAGLATLALRRQGMPAQLMLAAAAGEMIADKTPLVGDRVAPLPLAGRMAAGAIVGGVIAHEADVNIAAGALMGAAAAAVAAHLAYRVRRRWATSQLAGGIVEDVIMLGLAAYVASVRERQPAFSYLG